jgi:membrane-associated phospholipid phosphatase
MWAVRARALLRAAAAAGAAAAIGYAAYRTEEGARADRELFRWANRGHGPRADAFFFGITELGSLYASGAAAGALFLLGRRREAARAMGAAGAAWVAGQVVKEVVDRPRPYEDDPDGVRKLIAEPMGTSWPSSHPAVLTAFTLVAARELELGSAARATLSGLGASVAASRVYLGVHYPADVAGGLLMGRAVAHVWPRSSRSMGAG